MHALGQDFYVTNIVRLRAPTLVPYRLVHNLISTLHCVLRLEVTRGPSQDTIYVHTYII